MEPKREPGDDRVMWKISLLPARDSCFIEDQSGALDDFIGDAEIGTVYEVEHVRVTAEEWNELPEFEGW